MARDPYPRTGIRHLGALALLLAVPLLAAACGTPANKNAASTSGTRPHLVAPIPSSTTTTTKPPPPTTTTTTKPPPPTTTTVPPTTTTTQVLGPSGCPLSPLSDTPLPAGAFDVTVASVNLDGSHPNDQVIVYAVPSPGGAPFRMRAVLTTGYTVETDLSTVAPATAADAANQTAPAAQVLGGFDAAGTGKQLVFVQTNRVGSTDTDAAYAFTCGLVPITNTSSQVMALPLGGDSNGYYAFGCGRDSNNVPFMETLSAVSLDQGTDYNLTTTVYNFTGDSLTQTQQQSTTYTPPSGQTGPPPQMSTLACGAFGSYATAGTTATTTTTTPGATTTTTSSAGSTTTTSGH